MLDMPRPRYPYTHHERTRHGNWAWYFRKGKGPRIRLREPWGGPEFVADYEAALTGQPKPLPPSATAGTLRWLINRYFESAAFAGLKPATQRQKRSALTRVANGDGGSWKLNQVTKKRVMEGLDARRDVPFAGLDFIKAMRSLFRWALAAEHVTEDPTAGIKASEPRTEGHHTWTADELAQFDARHPLGSMARVAKDLILYVGPRASDLIVLGRQHVRNGVISYRSIKTGVEVDAPIIEPLAVSLAAAGVTGQLTFLLTEFGKPFKTVNGFGNWFRKRCNEAGLPHCTAHGIRKASATMAAEGGASDRGLMALYGWTTEKQAGTYTRKADRKKLAQDAADRLKAGTSIPAPLSEVRGSGRKAQ